MVVLHAKSFVNTSKTKIALHQKSKSPTSAPLSSNTLAKNLLSLDLPLKKKDCAAVSSFKNFLWQGARNLRLVNKQPYEKVYVMIGKHIFPLVFSRSHCKSKSCKIIYTVYKKV